MARKTLKLIMVVALGAMLAACGGGNNNSAANGSNAVTETAQPSPTATNGIEAEQNNEDTQQPEGSEGESGAESTDGNNTETPAPTATAKPATDKPAATKEPAQTTKPTAKPVATAKPTAKPSATAKPPAATNPPATAKPTAKPSPTPTPGGGTVATEKPVENKLTTNEIFDKIAEKYEQPMLMAIDAEMLKDLYQLDTALFEDYTVKTPMMNVKTNEIAIFKVKNTADIDTVKEGIKQRAEAVQKQFETYLPDQYENAKNYKLVVNGSYILFVISDVADDIVAEFNSLVK